jgi:hypothetical protein
VDMRQLRYFVQIVESGSLAKASRQLYIAQPALSQQMARLEDEVGRALLVRSSRGVTPTKNGPGSCRGSLNVCAPLPNPFTRAAARAPRAVCCPRSPLPRIAG